MSILWFIYHTSLNSGGPCELILLFPFEDMNGKISKVIHSTRKVAEQLSFAIDINTSFQGVYGLLECKECDAVLKYLDFKQSSQLCSQVTKLTVGYAIGIIRDYELSEHEYRAASQLCSLPSKNVKTCS